MSFPVEMFLLILVKGPDFFFKELFPSTQTHRYKGFKGNCSMTFIDQFKALHQCNKYCKMLGLKSLQDNSQKQKKPSIGRSKIQPGTTAVKKAASGSLAEKKS